MTDVARRDAPRPLRRFEERLSGSLLDVYLLSLRCVLPSAVAHMEMPSLLAYLGRSRRRLRVPLARASRAADRSEQWARHMRLRDTCLFRALVRWTALRHAGVHAEIVLGVARSDIDRGHAWVEVSGEVVNERPDPDLLETFRFPPRARPTVEVGER